ncbi:hypothetical protein BDF20DRAFT_912040 [Mycotypha africana]|uniref:uncharacterized protein n=1 Tax=Mycotypha africana TaxID=64632 RepID=UPI0022FFF058|nr:uncharacterized protein BDF20DRAFT_912040 [Mycotypha africana]KAI8981792.1 hypothetical protein BDF20DRAFT_912040 [Mycotypha africana]
MANIEEINITKRRSNEVEDTSLTPRPPPKKRFLSRTSSPNEESAGQAVARPIARSTIAQENEEEDEEDSTDPLKEPLEAFRKDAIVRQWKEYIRSIQRLKVSVEQAESKRLDSGNHFALWQDSFKKLQIFLSNIVQEAMSSLNASSDAMEIDNNSFDTMLKEPWATELAPELVVAFRKKDFNNLLISKLNQLLESWLSKREGLITGFDTAFEEGSLSGIKKDYENALLAWLHGQRSIQELKNRYSSVNFKYLLLSEELRLLNNRLQITDENLRQAQAELEKQKNRMMKGEDTEMKDTTTSTSIVRPTASTSSTQSPAHNMPSSTVSNSPSLVDPISQAQQLLNQRLRDIEIINEERIVLKEQIARLKMDLISVPESRIYRASLCRSLSQSRGFYKDKCTRLSDICHDLQHSLSDINSSRRRLIKDMEIEQSSRYKEAEEQLRKLDLDLTRTRGQRDALQMELEGRKASSEMGRVSTHELKVIAETRKEHVNHLLSEVLRMQRKMAATTGRKEFYEYLLSLNIYGSKMANGNSQDEKQQRQQQQQEKEQDLTDVDENAFLKPLQKEYQALKEQLEQTKKRVILASAEEVMNEKLEQIFRLKRIEKDAADFEAKYGFHPSLDLDDAQAKNILLDRTEKETSSLPEAKEKILNLEATEKQLLGEIDSVAKAYQDLEEENLQKVDQLRKAEDEVTKLQTERIKFSQIFTALNKSKDAHTMVANALTKQNEKQLAHIKQLNELEKNLNNQLTCLDRELASSNAVYDIYKAKLDEAKVMLDEMEEKTNISKDKILELQKTVFDKIRAIEESAHNRLRLEESTELLRRKVESSNRGGRPAEARLKREREEYRLLSSKTKVPYNSQMYAYLLSRMSRIDTTMSKLR